MVKYCIKNDVLVYRTADKLGYLVLPPFICVRQSLLSFEVVQSTFSRRGLPRNCVVFL